MLTMGQFGRWILVFLIAVAAGAGGYWLTRRAAQPVEATATPLADAPVAPTPATVIPERRPDITLADRDGKPRNLSEWNGNRRSSTSGRPGARPAGAKSRC